MSGRDWWVEVEVEKVRRRRLRHYLHRLVGLMVMGIGAIFALTTLLRPDLLDVRIPPIVLGGSAALIGSGAYVFWSDTREALRVNRVAIGTAGFYPPFKPKRNPTKADWFIPYKDIAAMGAVEARLGDFVPAYDVTLREGLTFQVNALDLLVYVDEAQVRRYAHLLAVIREEVMKPENRERAARGENIVIPRERFNLAAG